MYKNIAIIIVIFYTSLFTQPKTSEISSMPGAFSRLGFGARGLAMGNAMTAVNSGYLNSYYNPALNPFNVDNSVQLGYSFLSLDRNLNFLQLSKTFVFYKKDSIGNRIAELHSLSGVSIGLINFGVSDIDGRDNSGLPTKKYSTSENQLFLSVGIQPSNKVSIGITAKYYYYSLFDKMTSSSLGFDFGFLYVINDKFSVGGYLGDVNSKYRWDSTPIYGEDGNSNTIDYFPLIKRIGLCYKVPSGLGIFSIDFESTSYGTSIIKIGAEIKVIEFLRLRAGIDRINLKNSDMIPKPGFGLEITHHLANKLFNLNYAFVVEPYAPSNQHILTLGFKL